MEKKVNGEQQNEPSSNYVNGFGGGENSADEDDDMNGGVHACEARKQAEANKDDDHQEFKDQVLCDLIDDYLVKEF